MCGREVGAWLVLVEARSLSYGGGLAVGVNWLVVGVGSV